MKGKRSIIDMGRARGSSKRSAAKKATPKKTTSSQKIEVPLPSSEEDTLRTDLNATIEYLLALRSVRDQFDDAELNVLTDELGDKLVFLEKSLLDHLGEQHEHQDGIGRLTVSVISIQVNRRSSMHYWEWLCAR